MSCVFFTSMATSPRSTGLNRPIDAITIGQYLYFSEYNVVTSKSKYPPESIFGNFDLVICNNLLIYYNNKVKQDIVEKLLSSVRVDGYFITSEVEIDYVTRITKEETVLFQSPVLKKTIK